MPVQTMQIDAGDHARWAEAFGETRIYVVGPGGLSRPYVFFENVDTAERIAREILDAVAASRQLNGGG